MGAKLAQKTQNARRIELHQRFGLGLIGFDLALNWVCFGFVWLCLALFWLCFSKLAVRCFLLLVIV